MILVIAILLCLYCPIFWVITLLTKKKYEEHAFRNFSVSRLGTVASPNHKLFNWATVVFGILLIWFGFSLLFDTSRDLSGWIAELIVMVGGAVVGMGFLTLDKFPLPHNIVTVVATILINILAFLIFSVTYNTDLMSVLMKISAVIILFSTASFCIFLLWELLKRDRSKGLWRWQWVMFSAEILLVFLACSRTIQQLVIA